MIKFLGVLALVGIVLAGIYWFIENVRLKDKDLEPPTKLKDDDK